MERFGHHSSANRAHIRSSAISLIAIIEAIKFHVERVYARTSVAEDLHSLLYLKDGEHDEADGDRQGELLEYILHLRVAALNEHEWRMK